MICEPDGFLGAVMASQSIKGLKAMINGPGGCRSRTMNYLRELLLEYRGDDSCCCKSKYMSRVSMLPCTHLNADDIILGSATKISDGLKSVISSTGSDVVLLDTLGATVQVVDREQAVVDSGFADKVILATEDLSDLTFAEGFDDTMVRILDHYLPERKSRVKGKVNVLGYIQADRSWDYGKEEIRNLLSLLGLEVVSFIGCDCTTEEIRESAEVSLNILIHPEYSIQTARLYAERMGIPYIIPSQGSPLGFDPIRAFINEIAGELSLDAGYAMSVIDKEEMKVFSVIQNYDKFANGLRCSSMAFSGLASDALPVIRTVYEYFNVAPRSVELRGGNSYFDNTYVRDYLASIDAEDALGCKVRDSNLSLYFTDGLTAERYGNEHSSVNCIGVLTPFPDTVPLSDRCLVGFSGTRNLLDQVMNGMKRFTCGQPTPADFR